MPYYRGAELAETYARAGRRGYGFVASDLTHPDIMHGLLDGAAAVDSDIVLQVKRDTAEYFGNGDVAAGLSMVGSYLRTLSDGLDVGTFLNVDHLRADDDAMIDAAVESTRPSSLMVDASTYPFEENVERTGAVVDRVADLGTDTLVEGALGTIRGTEINETTTEAFYTDPERAVEFVDRTGCDLLAVSIGTEHGVAAGVNLDLRVNLAGEIGDALRDHGFDVPLVVHGSSGLTPEQVTALRAVPETVHVEDDLVGYMADIAAATRDHADVEIGVSPRGTQRLFEVSRARATLLGRDYVTPEDVKRVAHPVLAHRLVLRPEVRVEGTTGGDVIEAILRRVTVPTVE